MLVLPSAYVVKLIFQVVQVYSGPYHTLEIDMVTWHCACVRDPAELALALALDSCGGFGRAFATPTREIGTCVVRTLPPPAYMLHCMRVLTIQKPRWLVSGVWASFHPTFHHCDT